MPPQSNLASAHRDDLSYVGDFGTYRIDPHPHHARLSHVTLSAAALREFFAAVRDIDVQHLVYVPFARFGVARKLASIVGAGFPRVLRTMIADRNSGGFTLGVGGLTDDPEDYVKFGTAIGYLVGPANFDAMSGTYYARFVVKHTDSSDSYLRQAYRLFTLHTDGTFVEEATDWLLMMKFKESHAVGGESRLLHLDDWEALQRFSAYPMATQPIKYAAPASKNAPQPVERQTFFWNDGRPCMSFIDQFAQPETMEQANYLEALSESMESSPGTMAVPLPTGDLVVLNNLFWLHGRAPFERNPELFRELMRIRGSFVRADG